jgi:WXG100 family type VII secretion target
MAADSVTTTKAGRQAGSHFEHAINSANSHLQQINSEMATLQAAWHGAASAKFGQAMSDWGQQFDIVIKRVTHLLEVMDGNATVYTLHQYRRNRAHHHRRRRVGGSQRQLRKRPEMTQDQFDCALSDVFLDNLESINNGIKTMLAGLEFDVERSLAEWTSAEQAQYWDAKRQWNAATAKLPECLQRARVAFGEIVQELTNDKFGRFRQLPH